MELGSLGTPAALWRRWTLLAAGHAAKGSREVEVRRRDGSIGLGSSSDPAWLRLRRLAGHRAVMWGHAPGLDHGPRFREELVDSAPDWSFAVDSDRADDEVGFLAWHAHGSWSSVPAPPPGSVTDLMACLTSDEAILRWWASSWPAADRETLDRLLSDPTPATLAAVVGEQDAGAVARAMRQVELARGWQDRRLSEAATRHLRSQIHAQMRVAAETEDRGLPARPRLLRQWARVNLTGVPFRHAVGALSTSGRTEPGFIAASTDAGLDEVRLRSLDNVLTELRMAETQETSGAWMFARVTYDGRQVALERAFDHWPAWYSAADGPTMAALRAEMDQRAPRWRPGWSTLLPDTA